MKLVREYVQHDPDVLSDEFNFRDIQLNKLIPLKSPNHDKDGDHIFLDSVK
jgi:hypothetical protein